MGDFIMSGISFSTDALAGTPTAGTTEYNGTALYFTPTSTQRGVIPGMQYYRLDSALAGSNVSTAQSIFGVGVTLSASTVYEFEAVFALSKTAGGTTHSIGLGFGGSATINNISYLIARSGSTTSFNDGSSAASYTAHFLQTATNSVLTGAITSATVYQMGTYRGVVSINASGTFIPQYTLSAAPGGAYSTAINSYMLIYPIGAAGSNTSIGTWA